MHDGDAIAAPAPRKAENVASNENAVAMTDRFASMRPFTAGELVSTLALIFPPQIAVDLEVSPER